MANIFISYSRKDEAFARRVAQSLSERGINVWIDVEDIPAGMKWSRAIQQGLDTGDLMIVIISPDSMASNNVEDEWQYFLDNGKPVIPILLRSAKIHFQLSRIQYIDFANQGYDSAFSRLLVELHRHGIELEPLSGPEIVRSSDSDGVFVQPRVRRADQRGWVIGGVVALLVIAVVVIVVLVANSGSPDTGVDVAADATATEPTEPAALETEAPTPEPTTAVPTEPTATNTPSPTLEPTMTPTTPVIQPTATEVPGFAPVAHNAEWSPVGKDFGGMPMMLVPAGCFTMGSSTLERDHAVDMCAAVLGGDTCRSLVRDEVPESQICFDRPFWIDQYEVTASGQNNPSDVPRTNVTWQDAAEFCALRSARLPTEAEWEYAASGPDNLVYPWGNDFAGTRLNYCDSGCEFNWKDTRFSDGYSGLAPVGAFSDSASWVGAVNMTGNVWEWTSTIYDPSNRFPYPYQDDGRENAADTASPRVLRGGSWNWIALDARGAGRDDPIQASSDWYGFRCARDYQPGD